MSAGGGNQGWADRLATWLTAQSFNNVLLVLILGSIIGGTYYGIKEAIPAHLKTIQDGYDRLDTAHREERLSREQQHTEQTKSVVAGFEKAIERDMQLMEHMLQESLRKKPGSTGIHGPTQ